MLNRIGVNNVDMPLKVGRDHGRKRLRDMPRRLFAQFAEVVIGDFIEDKTQDHVQHDTDRLGQMWAEKIADHIRQSNS